jgi:hypothetical protein
MLKPSLPEPRQWRRTFTFVAIPRPPIPSFVAELVAAIAKETPSGHQAQHGSGSNLRLGRRGLAHAGYLCWEIAEKSIEVYGGSKNYHGKN